MALWRSLRSGGQTPPSERKDAVTRRHSAGPYYQFSGAPYSPPLGDLDLDRAVESQWGRVVWVYRAIDARAKNLARLTVRINTGRGPDAMEIENHPLATLLNRQANRYESGTSFRYRFSTLADLSKRGVFVEVVENNSGLQEVHLLNPKHTFPVPDPDKFVSAYHMRLPSGETFDLKPYKQGKGGVLWFRRPHPTDPYSSQTWLDAAGISIDLDHYARVYNRNFLANDGKPGGVLVVKSEEGVDDEVAAELQSRFAGGPQQAGRVSVLEADDLEYVDMSTTPRDAQYVESRALSKGEILGAAGTPESLWNASGRTFDNADAELEGWWRNDMVPEAEAIASFWEQLTPGGAVDDTEVVSYAWESITVLNRDERELEARLQAEWAAGTISLDEYREQTGKEPLDLPGSRVVWLTAGKAPVGQPDDVAAIMGQGQEAPPPEGGEVPPGGEPPPEGLPPENGPGGEGTPPAGDSTDPVGDALLDTGDPVGDALLAETKALPSEVGESDPFARQRAAQQHLVDTWVNACSDEIATLLRRQEKVILTRLTGAKARKHTRHWKPKNDTAPTRELKALDPEYIVDRRRWIDEVIAAIGDIVRAAFGAAGDRVLAALTGEGGFDPNTDAANEAVAKTVRIIAEGFDARAGRLQDVVAEGDAAGKTVDEIAADVQAAFTQAETWADVTSRQVVGAMNAAQQIAAVDSGATRKRWLATDDERTRESHRDAEGQVVDITEPFSVGEGVLMFPGDPTGPIGEWINCRCTMLFQSPERDFDAELDADLAALDEIEAGEKALIGRAARAIAGSFGSFDVRFDPSAHPRDHRGRFVDTPDVVLPDGTRGVAVSENDNGTITVAKPTGAVVNVDPAKVTDPPKPKPKPAPASFRPLTGGLTSPNVAAPAGVNGPDELPPPIGTAPIPEGTVRLYHVTWTSNLDGIRGNGLLESQARGDGNMGAGNEPSAGVWASTGRPNGMDLAGPNPDSDRVIVEFYATPEQISDRADRLAGRTPDEFSAGYHHVIMRGDVPPEQIVAVHEPWHSAVRFLTDRQVTIDGVLAGEYDDARDESPAYAKAIDYVKEHADELRAALTEDLVSENVDYRGSHQPPSRGDDVGASIVDMEQVMPDLYSRPNLYTTRSGDPDMEVADQEALAAITAARGKPDAMVTVYRAVPPGVDTINPGDWVTPSRRYAEMHGRQSDDPAEDWPVISREVRAADLLTPGDAIHEFGWQPESLVSENVYMWHGRVRTVPPEVATQGVQAVEDYLRAEDGPTLGDLITPNVTDPIGEYLNRPISDNEFQVHIEPTATENWIDAHDGRQPETDADYAEVEQWANSLRESYQTGEMPMHWRERDREDIEWWAQSPEITGLSDERLREEAATASPPERALGAYLALQRRDDTLVSWNVDGQAAPIPLADLVSASLWAEGDTSGRIPDTVGEVFDTWLGPATVTERGFKVTLNIEGRGPVTVEVTPPVDPSNRRAGTARIVDDVLVTPSVVDVPVKSKANERLKAGDTVTFYDTETGQARLGTVWSEAPVAGSGHKGSWWVVPAEPKPGEPSAIVVAGRGKSDRQAPTTAVGPDELFHDPDGPTGKLTRAGAGSDTYPNRYDGKPLSARDRTVIDRIRNDLPLDKIPTNDLDAMARQGLIERRGGGGFMGTADWVVVEQPRSTRERMREVLNRRGNIRGSLYNDLYAALYVSNPNDPVTQAVRVALDDFRPDGWDPIRGQRWSNSVMVRDAVEAALAATPDSAPDELISANRVPSSGEVNSGDTPYFGTGDQATFSERLGNCYELSTRAVVMGAPEGSKVVYGTIQGDGQPPLGHAWVELPNGNIWEPISHTVSDPDEFTLQFGAIPHQSYTKDEAAREMVTSGHHGPWYPVDDRGIPLDGAPTDEDRQQARAEAGRNLVAKITGPVRVDPTPVWGTLGQGVPAGGDPMVAPNLVMVEAGTFHPEDHPIDTFGNFQEAPLVRLPDGRTGMATRRNTDGTVAVIGPDGESSDMRPEDLTEVTEAGFRSDLLAPNVATTLNMRRPTAEQMYGDPEAWSDLQLDQFRIYTAPDGRAYLLQMEFNAVVAKPMPSADAPITYEMVRHRETDPARVGMLSWFGGSIRRNEDGAPDDRSNINGGVISGVGVKPAHRRNGLATAMLAMARELEPDQEIRHSGALSDDGRAWSLASPNTLVSPRLDDVGGFHGTLSAIAHGIMEAFQAFDIGGVDDEPPGEVNVVAEIPAAPAGLPIPERFRARYRNQYLLAANVDTVGSEALSRIPDLRELMGRGMDPGEARAEYRRLYDEEVARVSAERAALQSAVQQDVLTDFDELPEGVDPLHYMDAGSDKPRAIYGLSHNEAVALGSAGMAPGPGAVRDWVGGFSTWAVPAERLDDGDMVPFRGVPIQGRTIPFGYVTKIDGMPILVEAGTEEAARERAALVAGNWKIATADVNSDLVLESTVGIAWTATPLSGDPFNFSRVIATGGDGTITFWDFPPDTHTLRHEAAHNIDNYDKRNDLMAPRKAYRDEWVETVVADRQVFKNFLSVTHNHWEGFREAETDHPIVWEAPDRELDPVAHGLDGDSPGEGLTDYGRAAVVEDYAESAALFLRDRRYGQLATAEVRGPEYEGIAFPVRFADMHPHRARYFDRIYGLTPAPISMLQHARLDSLTRDRGPISEWSDNQLMLELRMHGIDPSGLSRDAMLEALAGIPGVGMYMEA